MELEKIMKLKVILFTNEKFFFNFKNILLKLAYEIYIERQHDLLTDRIEKKNINYFSSKWFYIMKLMFSKIFIPDYSKIKDLENKSKEYIIKNLNSYEIDKFQYYYLKEICINKLKKLNFLSFKLKISLINIIRIYSDLCIKEIKKRNNLNNSKGIELLFNKNKKLNIFNKKYNYHLGNKPKNTKMSNLLFTSLNKSEMPALRENKNRKNSTTITNIISKNNNTIDLFGKRSNSVNQKLLYCNSFTRLFIGETDKDSIIERHLSNILVLKPNDLKINGSYIDLSERYLQKIVSNLNQKNKKLLIDESLKETLEKFKVNQKYLEHFNKSNSIKDSKIKINKSINIHINDMPFTDKNGIENKIINSYNYKPYQNNFIRKIRKVNSAKVRENKKPKNNKKMKNESSILIENLCKELSDSKYFSKKNKNKKIKKNLWINTNYNSLDKNKKFYFRNNYNFCKNYFRTTTVTNTNYNYSKKDYKDILNKKDLFFNIKI